MARGKTREVMALRKDLHATENKLAEMEEKLQELQDELACSANKTVFRKAQADADADYEEETGECTSDFRIYYGLGFSGGYQIKIGVLWNKVTFRTKNLAFLSKWLKRGGISRFFRLQQGVDLRFYYGKIRIP